jgi:hypothetical protein
MITSWIPFIVVGIMTLVIFSIVTIIEWKLTKDEENRLKPK